LFADRTRNNSYTLVIKEIDKGFAWFVNWGSCAFAAAAAWLASFGLAAQMFIPPLSYHVYTSNTVSCFL
jgi:hypothetical protein